MIDNYSHGDTVAKQGDSNGVFTMQLDRKRRGPFFTIFENGGPLLTGFRGSLSLSSVDR